jgi:hypothetical protein
LAGMATMLQAVQMGMGAWDFSFHSIQTAWGICLASYPVGTAEVIAYT